MLLRLLRNGRIASSVVHLERKLLVYYERTPRFIVLKRNEKLLCPQVRSFSDVPHAGPLDDATFERVCNETLESLSEYFEEILEESRFLKDADVVYGDGVLTIKFGRGYGTYVINRQSPNKQIWLSSPVSGPKRYDFLEGQWVYRHDGITLHELLNREIQNIAEFRVDFNRCAYSNPKSR
ncbi:hypothetical protein J437_LFUL007210 [Ladona fulva]|uniref:ferroxidase n=1 Tax=Ladona fulva TaxID=123851 RepID=A0A8K0K483_LADFU|nr:hypothetical protein J437_LFUL007210 [Ladona fulva]